MNYLAHALLSGNKQDLLIGNFIADHLRGNTFSGFSPGIVEGIFMHRRIDAFTDAHPVFKKAKRVFYENFEKHSGILVDIYFDHLLAKNFSNFHSTELKFFAQDVYGVYNANRHLLPTGSNRFLDYVLQNNVYESYSSIKGIETVLGHLSYRIKHNVKLDESVPVFLENEKMLEPEFEAFFNEAQKLFGNPGT